jgi:hypothetical protein
MKHMTNIYKYNVQSFMFFSWWILQIDANENMQSQKWSIHNYV